MIGINYKAQNISVVVVGANSGIGQTLCKQLLESKATVIGIDIQYECTGLDDENYTYFQVNPLIESEMISAAKAVENITSSIYGLVNLSGTIDNFKSIEETTSEAWSKTYDISFKSCFNSVKSLLPLLRKSKNAAIVNMSSGLAFGGQKKYGAYTTAKNAIISFSRTLATELAPAIRVNALAPGAVDTSFIYQEDGSTRFDKKSYENIVPLGSIGKPEEISNVILFLLSQGASHITGQCIHVNGGALMT